LNAFPAVDTTLANYTGTVTTTPARYTDTRAPTEPHDTGTFPPSLGGETIDSSYRSVGPVDSHSKDKIADVTSIPGNKSCLLLRFVQVFHLNVTSNHVVLPLYVKQKPNHVRLLRMRRERLCGRRTADEREELAAFHCRSLPCLRPKG
jgi:hypothetical protein